MSPAECLRSVATASRARVSHERSPFTCCLCSRRGAPEAPHRPPLLPRSDRAQRSGGSQEARRGEARDQMISDLQLHSGPERRSARRVRVASDGSQGVRPPGCSKSASRGGATHDTARLLAAATSQRPPATTALLSAFQLTHAAAAVRTHLSPPVALVAHSGKPASASGTRTVRASLPVDTATPRSSIYAVLC